MKASMTQEEPRVTPHPASRRALQDELARLKAEWDADRAMLKAQDARLAKTGADLEESRARAGELDRIAAQHRLLDRAKGRRARAPAPAPGN